MQGPKPRTDRAADGFLTGECQQNEERDDFLGGEASAVDLGPDEHAEEGVGGLYLPNRRLHTDIATDDTGNARTANG